MTGNKWEEYWLQFGERKNRLSTIVEGAENLGSVRKRAMTVLYELEEKYKGKNILIVTHEGVTAMLQIGIIAEERKMQDAYEKRLHHLYENAEVGELNFWPFPHNAKFELDYHRPYIDEVKLACECGGEMSRVKEVMDVWFDSGAMPFAQDHYPFENKEWVEGKGYPADFISEALDQTRGWFYSLLAVGVLMERGTPYKNVICLGHILDKEGKKMSKSIGNVVNPWEMIDKYGVDALRMWMYSVNQPGDSKNFDEQTVDEIVKKVWNPLSNVYALYSLYEDRVPRVSPLESKDVLDIWILARFTETNTLVTEYLDNYKTLEPVRALRDFVQDFSTWYIRRSRDRFKSEDRGEVSRVTSVAEHVLVELSKLLAPFAPFYSEWLYSEVTKGNMKESVHLENWSEMKAEKEHSDILKNMRTTREIVSLVLEARQKAGIKVRQPLQSLQINTDLGEEYLELIRDEVNVKEVFVGPEIKLDTTITPELKLEGDMRDLVRIIQDKRKEMGLAPSDTISVTLPQPLGPLGAKFENEIKKAVHAESLDFDDNLKDVKIQKI